MRVAAPACILCVCLEPQPARHEPVCAGVAHAVNAGVGSATHAAAANDALPFLLQKIPRRGSTGGRDKNKSIKPATKEPDCRPEAGGSPHPSPPPSPTSSPLSCSDLEEASNPKVTPRRKVHILGPETAGRRLGAEGCEGSPVVDLPRAWRSVRLSVCLSV